MRLLFAALVAHLTPKLRALAHYSPLSLSLPASLPSGTSWVPVEWHFDRAGAVAAVEKNLESGDADTPPDQPGAGSD